MKNLARFSISRVAVAAAILLAGGVATAYDEPDFDFEAFSPDGIFLEPNQRQSLLEALASLAANFTDDDRVDGDLREKALALALRLDPLHYDSRRVHGSLLRGATPQSTQYFDKLSTITETLWQAGSRLTEEPLDPEEVRLASYLMELSLLLHPDPSRDRLVAFGRAVDSAPLRWKRFIDLEADADETTVKAEALRREAAKLAAAAVESGPPQPQQTASAPGEGGGGRGSPDSPDPAKPPSPGEPKPPEGFEPVSRSLTAILPVETPEKTALLAGEVTLSLRRDGARQPGRSPERSRAPPDGARLPLFRTRDSIRLKGLDIPTASWKNRSNHPWPNGVVATIRFSPGDESLPGPRRTSRAPARLAALMLIGSALGKSQIDERFVLSGVLPEPDASPRVRSPPLDVLEAAARANPGYLLFPASGISDLIDSVAASERLNLLFSIELVGYDDVADALAKVTTPADETLREASDRFGEIRAALERGTLSTPDFVRNAKVQERLDRVLEAYPDHLSARALREIGGDSGPDSARVKRWRNRIDAIVEPFYALREEPPERFPLKNHLEEADRKLFGMHRNTPDGVTDYLFAAEEAIEAAEAYLKLSNHDTSNARQRLEKARQLLDELEAERAALETPEVEE